MRKGGLIALLVVALTSLVHAALATTPDAHKPAEAKPEAHKAEAKPAAEHKAEAKPAAAEKPGEHKPEAKPGETSAKPAAAAVKPGEHGAGKPGDKPAEKPVEKAGEHGAKPDTKAGAHAAGKGPALGEGPSGSNRPSIPTLGPKRSSKAEEPQTMLAPTLRLSALRDEMKNPRAAETRGLGKDGERAEQLLADLNKARESLRKDTARMEELLAKAQAPAAPKEAPAPSPEEETGKKAPPPPLDGLAKSMRGMKPEQAAQILSRVDRKLAADVLQRMPANDAGRVMGACKPETAAELAAEIASRMPRTGAKR